MAPLTISVILNFFCKCLTLRSWLLNDLFLTFVGLFNDNVNLLASDHMVSRSYSYLIITCKQL